MLCFVIFILTLHSVPVAEQSLSHSCCRRSVQPVSLKASRSEATQAGNVK